VYAYRIPGPPRRQAEEITTLQDEYAEVALRETIGQRAAAESGADHYGIITLRYRRNPDSGLPPQVVNGQAITETVFVPLRV